MVVPVVFALALIVPGAGFAQEPPPESSAVEQYRESVPTSGGARLVGAASERATPLPPTLAERVEQQAGKDAPLLKRVATSSAFGAPRSSDRPDERRPTLDRLPAWTLGDSLRAGGSALTHQTGEGRLLVVLVLCLGIAGAGLARALRAHGRESRA